MFCLPERMSGFLVDDVLVVPVNKTENRTWSDLDFKIINLKFSSLFENKSGSFNLKKQQKTGSESFVPIAVKTEAIHQPGNVLLPVLIQA